MRLLISVTRLMWSVGLNLGEKLNSSYGSNSRTRIEAQGLISLELVDVRGWLYRAGTVSTVFLVIWSWCGVYYFQILIPLFSFAMECWEPTVVFFFGGFSLHRILQWRNIHSLKSIRQYAFFESRLLPIVMCKWIMSMADIHTSALPVRNVKRKLWRVRLASFDGRVELLNRAPLGWSRLPHHLVPRILCSTSR
jgi:hypothetical protein